MNEQRTNDSKIVAFLVRSGAMGLFCRGKKGLPSSPQQVHGLLCRGPDIWGRTVCCCFLLCPVSGPLLATEITPLSCDGNQADTQLSRPRQSFPTSLKYLHTDKIHNLLIFPFFLFEPQIVFKTQQALLKEKKF